MSQTVAFTEITVKYSRPLARGRTLFGDSGVVKWNDYWNPGADSASRVRFSHDVELEGRPVKAGDYSLWLIPRPDAPWTFILSRAAAVYHEPYPGDSLDAHRFDIPVERGAHMETMAFYFPLVRADEAVLRLHWGDIILPVRIKAPYRPG